MDFAEYYASLKIADQRASDKALERFAKRAGTTRLYIETHLIAPPGRRRMPRKKLMYGFVEASDGQLTLDDVLAYFYEREPEKRRA